MRVAIAGQLVNKYPDDRGILHVENREDLLIEGDGVEVAAGSLTRSIMTIWHSRRITAAI